MKRREFIAGLGGAAAWPLAARAQQADRVRRIGVLMGFPAGDPEAQARIAVLLRGLHDLGWVEGRNLRLEYRWAGESLGRTRADAAELVATKPDVIIATTTSHGLELVRLTRTIPIPVVFINLADPVETGVVASLAYPGGNATGYMSLELSIAGKLLELLKKIAPSVNRVLVLMNVGNAGNLGYLRIIEASASPLDVRVSSSAVRNAGEIETAIAAVAGEANVGLIVMPGDPIQGNRQMIFALAARHRLPAVYVFRFFVADGGLMSYGPDVLDLWRRAASYIDRILKGEKPSHLPVQTPTKFELVINLKTAKALGLTIPETLLATADEVIQ